MKNLSLSIGAFILLLLFCFPFAGQACAEVSVPIAENMEITAKRNAPTTGRLRAQDADNDLKGFEITTKPVKGEIRLEEDGRFVYTPRPNGKGRDYFGYRAIDEAGKVSEEATVLIRIEK